MKEDHSMPNILSTGKDGLSMQDIFVYYFPISHVVDGHAAPQVCLSSMMEQTSGLNSSCHKHSLDSRFKLP